MNSSGKLIKELHIIAKMIRPWHPPVASLEHDMRKTPFRILIAVVLSARTRDETTAAASRRLFRQAATPAKMAKMNEQEIGRLIYPVGFWRQKAKHVLQISRLLLSAKNFPSTLAELQKLPGVGRKTANLVLALALGKPAIAVDTHVFRISRRLGWAQGESPLAVEEQLTLSFPRRYWRRINHILVGFGQTICKPQRPLCDRCRLQADCPDRRRRAN